MLDRRSLLTAFALGPFGAGRGVAQPTMTVFKDPNCGCCGAWVDHIRAAGSSRMFGSRRRWRASRRGSACRPISNPATPL